MRLQVIFGLVAVVVASVTVPGCYKKSGRAAVLEKEHIAAREITPTPAAQQSAGPGEPTSSPGQLAPEKEYKPRVLAKDEIVVDTYVMKKDARGTSRDPRAMRDEQWIVRVQMIDDLRRLDVHTDQPHFDHVRVGDRIKVSYRQGKYTGTVWSAELD
jgi:hypothetical protein